MNQPAQAASPSSPSVLDSAGQVAPAALETPLLAALLLKTSEISAAAYRGARTAAVFSSPAQELRALLSSVGVYDLGWRTGIACTGEDRVRWLNGMVTNHVGALTENHGCYAFVLNAQGRIQGDLNIYQRGDALWLDTDIAQAETLTTFLDRFIIMDDVALEPLPTMTRLGIAGPHAVALLTQIGLAAEGLEPLQMRALDWRGNAVTLVAAHSPLTPRMELWIPQSAVQPFWQTLLEAGAIACGATAIEDLRILEGTPAYGTDIKQRDLPQETNQTRALHFTKGCYLGQEIVERIRSRGNVHRTFSGFVLGANFATEGVAAAEKTPLLAEDQPVGDITSAAKITLPDGRVEVFALGYIRREILDRKSALHCNGSVAAPSALPFLSQ